MSHRDFDSAADEYVKNRPTFTLGGRVFTCRPTLGVKLWLKIQHEQALGQQAINDATSLDDFDEFAAARPFFDRVLIKADRKPFWDLVGAYDEDDDDEVAITLVQLNDISEWLTERYVGFPTSDGSDSGSTPPSTGPNSTPQSAESEPQDGPSEA